MYRDIRKDTLLSQGRTEKLTGWRPIDGFHRLLPWGSGATDPWRVNPKAAFVPDRLVLFLSRSATLIILRTTSCPSLFIRLPFLSAPRALISSVQMQRRHAVQSCSIFVAPSAIYPLRRANKVTLVSFRRVAQSDKQRTYIQEEPSTLIIALIAKSVHLECTGNSKSRKCSNGH